MKVITLGSQAMCQVPYCSAQGPCIRNMRKSKTQTTTRLE